MADKIKRLKDFPVAHKSLKTSRKQQVTLLHKFVFEGEGNRKNRQRLRDFRGFSFDKNDDGYKKKCDYVHKNHSDAGLTSICILLGLNHDQQNKAEYIVENLCAGYLLEDANHDEDDQ